MLKYIFREKRICFCEHEFLNTFDGLSNSTLNFFTRYFALNGNKNNENFHFRNHNCFYGSVLFVYLSTGKIKTKYQEIRRYSFMGYKILYLKTLIDSSVSESKFKYLSVVLHLLLLSPIGGSTTKKQHLTLAIVFITFHYTI